MNALNESNELNEEPLLIEGAGAPLVGMLHRASASPRIGVMVMVADGPQYRIGGHRQLVLWARRMAAAGFPVLRFDFTGMGDSYGDYVGFEYAGDDLRAALARFVAEQPTLERIVLWGECNACSASLFYAHKDPRIAGLIMLNPWVRTEQSQARAVVKHYYLQRLTQRSFWTKVAKLEFDFAASLRSAYGMLVRARRQASPTGTVPAAIDRRPLPERMFDGLRRFRGRVLLVMSGRDMIAREFDDLLQANPAWRDELVAHAAVRHDLAAADHTFSTAQWRDQVVAWAIDWLQELAAEQTPALRQARD